MAEPHAPSPRPARVHRPGRRRARGRATRARLLEAAGELFRRRGYHGTSVVDVSERAGVSVGTVYHHFADKRAMLLALIDDWADRVEARRRGELDLERFLGDDPRGAIRRWLRRAYERERKEPSLYVVVLGLADRDEEVRRRYHRLEQGAIARLHELVALGQRRGVMRPDLDAEAVAFLVHHAIDTAATRLLVRKVASPDADRSSASSDPDRVSASSDPDRVLEALADMIARTLLEDDR